MTVSPIDERLPMLTRRRLAGVCVALLIAVTTTSSSGQSRPPSTSTPADAALRAFNTGQFDEVDTLLGSATDARSIVIRARADIARGRYGEAEKRLTPLAAASAGGDAALELGVLLTRLGRRQDGTRLLQGVLAQGRQETAADLLRAGLAARALGRFQDANTFLRRAVTLAPNDPVANAARGDLFLEKYDPANAVTDYQAALKIDPDHVPALVGLARAMIENNPPAARELLDTALAKNPNYVPAHVLAAEMALDDRRRADAQTAIRQALAVNPNSLEARSLDAAVAFLEARTSDFDAIVAGVLKLNPVYGEVYRIAGDHAARSYRFDEGVELTRKAIAIDKNNARAHADMGMQLLRTGDEPGARVALETAYKFDPYDIVTFNLLDLLKTIDTFETVRDGDIIVRLHPQEAAVMREYVPALARRALETLSKQYQFTPRGPILIEMFPKHDDFAVRTLGLPGFIGALGACFGRVVTLDSPRARTPGEFSWAATLWHEMAHVITLQMSNNRLPRWLSEGISVFEERRARPDWGREMEVPFAQALDGGKLLKLRDLNEGFSDPRLISLTYYQASLVVEHLIATYGEPALWRFIRAYGEGLETDEAARHAFNASMDDIQVSFDARIERQYAAPRRALKAPEIPPQPSVDHMTALAAANPDSFTVHMELAKALHKAGDAQRAIEALERASTLLPAATGDDNPNVLIAAIAAERGDTPRAIRALEAVVKVDSADVESARKLAALLTAPGDTARATAAYALVAELDPFDVGAQAAVGRAALQRGDADLAVRALRAALAADPPDKAVAYVDLAEAYLLAGRLQEAKDQVLAAGEIAPAYERAGELLLKIREAAGDGQ